MALSIEDKTSAFASHKLLLLLLLLMTVMMIMGIYDHKSHHSRVEVDTVPRAGGTNATRVEVLFLRKGF